MRLNIKAGLSVFLGLITGHVMLDLMGVRYNLVRDPFNLWMAIEKLGTPMACALLWFWVIKAMSGSPK